MVGKIGVKNWNSGLIGGFMDTKRLLRDENCVVDVWRSNVDFCGLRGTGICYCVCEEAGFCRRSRLRIGLHCLCLVYRVFVCGANTWSVRQLAASSGLCKAFIVYLPAHFALICFDRRNISDYI